MHEAATRLFHRMTQVEKMTLRAATVPAGVEHLACNAYMADLVGITDAERIDIVTDTRALCDLEFATKSAGTGF